MLKKGLIVFTLLAAVFMILMAIQKKRQEIRNEQYRADYPRAIKEYLKDKYGKNFYVNPDYHFYSGSPIPASNTRSPYMFEVWEEGNDGYVFNVWIDTVSFEDDQIEEIQDNYCWKFFVRKVKGWFLTEMADALPEKYKFICLLDLMERFDKSVKPDSPLECYFETSIVEFPLTFFLVLPPESRIQDSDLREEILEKTVNSFYKEYPNTRIIFHLVQTKKNLDYNDINIKELENSRFYLHKEIKSIWEIKSIERKIKIEVGE